MQSTTHINLSLPWYDPAWQYRKRITIDRAMVAGARLTGFPVLVTVIHPELRTTAHGGHVVQPNGEDLRFVDVHGQPLECEIQRYDPATGRLRAWVRMPALPHDEGSPIHLYYGNPHARRGDLVEVWDTGYRLVLHIDPAADRQRDSSAHQNDGQLQQVPLAATRDSRGQGGDFVVVSHSSSLEIENAITVEAWVVTEQARAEALQSLVSKWTSLSSFDTFDAYDAGNTDGLRTQGFFGAVFDGRYVYFSPAYDGTANHGRVLRYDTHGTFDEPRSWSAYDAGDTDGLRTRGYYGAVYDGRYVYFVPRLDKNFTPEVTHHSRILRYDTQGDFKDPTSWRAHDAGEPASHQSAAFDGRYIYFCPGYEHPRPRRARGLRNVEGVPKHAQLGNVVPSGRMLRYDTQGDFNDPRSYTVYDASCTSGLATTCYDGAAFDGRYVYFAPLETQNVVLRYDTHADFCQSDGWQAFDTAAALGLGRGWSVGMIFDGRYMYVVPYSNGVVVRYDTCGNFQDAESWAAYDAGFADGIDTKGYDGAVFDGKYLYFIPFYRGRDLKTDFHARVLRYDTTMGFQDPAAWAGHDAEGVSGVRAIGFNGGTFDGRFMYCSPWRDGVKDDGLPSAHGRVLRYDTTGAGASFSLRYDDCGHNGGLTTALPGATFLVNTAGGALNARASKTLDPGWHHLVGVYDGQRIALLIDGEVAGERPGSGKIQTCDADVLIGRLQDGLGYFDGRILEVRISAIARSRDWIQTEYRNLSQNARYVKVGEEESQT
jgi:Concanavalin A-like lectin/glucanases superfamily/Domain of unknown function (DUF2341)